MSKRIDEPAFKRWPWDDSGNADRLVERYADRLRWVGDNNAWAVYDDQTGLWGLYGVGHAAAGLMRKTIERMKVEEADHYSEAGDPSPRAKWLGWCARQGGASTLANGLSVAKTKRALSARMADFDNDEGWLHVPNGVLSLGTFELMPHSQDFMLTVGATAEYRPDVEDQMWQEYLDTFLPDPELRRFVQKAVGYSLQVGNPARLFFICLGPTSSGKSTLNEVISAALGSYAQAVNLSLFKANQKPGGTNTELAHALLARWVAATEASQQWRLHADEIKRITGGDTMSARHVFEKATVRRRPAFTPWIFTNAMPNIEGRDVAFDRRLVVIPFNSSVLGRKEDKEKTARMLACPKTLSAALAWAVEGLRLYREEGLEPPAVVRAAKEGAIGDLSDVDRFLSERCVVEEGAWVNPTLLYQEYRDWCIRNDIADNEKLNAVRFGSAMTQRGYVRGRGPKSEGQPPIRKGLRLAAEEEPSLEQPMHPTYAPAPAPTRRRRAARRVPAGS